MFSEGIFPIGDGLLDINEDRLKELLVADDINEIYELEQTPFARGKFAAVRRAIHKNSGVHFAAKFLKRRRRAQSSDKEIKHEIAVLKLCDGAENIVKLNAVHESRSDTALLLELATGGELQTFLDNEECLSEAHARYCMREVLKALQYLHKRSIAHLDLKPQNILLTGERIEDGLKLCDFGISRVVAEGTNVREIVGTPDYVAPEVLQYEPLSLLTDIWSVGVLTYVLLSGFSPFGGETKQETFLNISQCALTFPDKLFGGVSAVAIDFIRRALRIKPNDRMTAAGCLEHIWLKDECSIDRQILSDITKSTTVDSAAAADDEDDDDEDEDEDDVEEDVDEEVEANEAEIENEMLHDADDGVEDDTIVNISVDDNAEQVNGTNGSKMESSDVEEIVDDDGEEEKEEEKEKPQPNKSLIVANGKAAAQNNANTNGYSNCNGRTANHYNATTRYNGTTTYTNGLGGGAKCTNGTRAATSDKNASPPSTTTIQRTTAIVTVPAMRATTIPLQYNGIGGVGQQRQQLQHKHQQQLQVFARRHSTSDSNKENTFLTTKKIPPTTTTTATTNIATVVKKPLTATTTTTIVIAGNGMGGEVAAAAAATVATTPNVVATFTLSNGYNQHNGTGSHGTAHNHSNNNNAHSEKYIATTTTSTTATHCLFPDAPTTPKVIRKTPNTEVSPTSVKALVKKFQLEGGNTSPTSGYEKHAAAHLKEAQTTNQQTTAHTNGGSVGGKMQMNGGSKKSPLTNNGIAKKSEALRKYAENGSANGYALTNGRRASEPTTTVTQVTVAHSRTASGDGGGSATASYKSTCVLCISCGGKATNGSSTANGCRHTVDKYNKNKSNNNFGKSNCNSNGSSSSNSSSSSSSTTTALLMETHHPQQQQQHHISSVHHHHHHLHPHPHHHHHMHAVAAATAATTKNGTTNNLSLDQGIIC